MGALFSRPSPVAATMTILSEAGGRKGGGRLRSQSCTYPLLSHDEFPLLFRDKQRPTPPTCVSSSSFSSQRSAASSSRSKGTACRMLCNFYCKHAEVLLLGGETVLARRDLAGQRLEHTDLIESGVMEEGASEAMARAGGIISAAQQEVVFVKLIVATGMHVTVVPVHIPRLRGQLLWEGEEGTERVVFVPRRLLVSEEEARMLSRRRASA